MTTMATKARGAELVAGDFESWLRDNWPGAERANVLDIAASGAGASNETYMLRVDLTGAGVDSERLIARAPPSGQGIFCDYDLESQARIMNLLGAAGMPVPYPVGYCATSGGLGAPFVIMPFIDGRVPSSTVAPYTVDGWVYDLPLAQQRLLVENFTDALADLHRLDPVATGFIQAIPAKKPGLSGELDWWHDYRVWASASLPAELADPLAEAMVWCEKTRPEPLPPDTISWGDARFGKVIFGQNLDVAALLDGEMASVGPAEVDYGFHLAHRRHSAWLAGRSGMDDLPGAPSREEQLARYEARLGRRLECLPWYEVFGMLRISICHLAIRRIFQATGVAKMKLSPPIPEWTSRMMSEIGHWNHLN